jgi:menaquinone-9 beta-reductase
MRKLNIGIVGGGLAGLCLAIQSAQQGHNVVLFEKDDYPKHKVCGEYISNESKDFLKRCGVDVDALGASTINKLIISAPNNTMLNSTLPLGGFGISRYTLDLALYNYALKIGVQVYVNCRVNEIVTKQDSFAIQTNSNEHQVDLAFGTFGKRSNLDIAWQRNFIQQKANKLNNYIGIKYHLKYNMARDLIALHNFEDGYAGISAIEDDKFCFCYLTKAHHLQTHKSIAAMEKEVLCKNPQLQHIFKHATFLYSEPLSISQISFEPKEQSIQNICLAGDAAGMITPLCGNGMSMALHASKLLADQIYSYSVGKISMQEMQTQYATKWRTHFSKRLAFGRFFQKLFGKSSTTNFAIGLLKRLPFAIKLLVKQTHGKAF